MWAAIAVQGMIMVSQCPAGRIAVGESLPSISAKTLSGEQYDHDAGSNQAVLVAFLLAGQKSSQQAVEDLQRVLPAYKDYRGQIQVVIVMDDAVYKDSFQNADIEPNNNMIYLIHDTEKKIWGQFHIVAAPTVVVADKSNKVASVVAGHGYDFVASLRFHLNQVLGIAQTMTAEDVGKVKTVQNQTSSARVERHLKMSKMLQEKGKIDASLQQLDLARQIDPNNLQVALEAGHLYCQQNKPDLALKAVEGLAFAATPERAGYELIVGWANRLLGDLETAQKHLLKATELSPASARAWFELGQVYEATSQSDLALSAYKKGLSILMDCN